MIMMIIRVVLDEVSWNQTLRQLVEPGRYSRETHIERGEEADGAAGGS